jgi:hypothetical protein
MLLLDNNRTKRCGIKGYLIEQLPNIPAFPLGSFS